MEYGRNIVVKGVGKASKRPDLIVINLDLDSFSKSYEKAMSIASKKLEELYTSLAGIGFERKDIKTVGFNVRTKNEYVKDKNGDSVLMFLGYVVEHSLKISFDLDMKKLPETLSVISTSKAKPRVDIAFTLKDDSEIKEEALRNASINARKKAEILAITSGVKLGKLISIDYSWKDIELYSDTKCYDSMPSISKMASIDIEPDDIKAEDSVTFTWEIEVDDLSYDL